MADKAELEATREMLKHNKLLLFLIAIPLPPVAVWLKRDKLDLILIISCALCILGWIPG